VISFTARIADEGVEGMLSQDNGSDAASMSIMNGVMKAGKNGLREYYAVGI
jgi:hypothetical protein